MPLRDLAGRERQRPHGAAVKGAQKGDHLLPLRVIAGQLDRRFHRLGPGIREEDLFGKCAGRDLRQLFRQLELGPIVKIGPRHVEQLRRLAVNGLDDARMAVARRTDRDARVEIEEAIAIDVLDHGALRRATTSG